MNFRGFQQLNSHFFMHITVHVDYFINQTEHFLQKIRRSSLYRTLQSAHSEHPLRQ
nr:MAG TPA: hypothetical protein [Caudoviricetes sp.]